MVMVKLNANLRKETLLVKNKSLYIMSKKKELKEKKRQKTLKIEMTPLR